MKQRMMRKTLSWALVLSMLLTMLPTAAFAEEVPLVGAYAEAEEAKFEEKFEAKAELAEEAELFATSETVNVSSVSELQSAHPYNNNMDKTWIYTHPTSAAELSITFSADTETESRYDYIYIYDGAGNQIGKYDGTTLAGQSIAVPGNVVKIKLTSDGSVQKNGFTVTNISETGEVVPEGDASEFAGGHGTAASPYLIANATHLNNVRNYLSAHFKMTADIVFTDADFAEDGDFYNNGTGWSPIGDATTPFTGIFDGSGHTITGLKQSISSTSERYFYAGLFGYANGAAIKNLGMLGSNISIAVSSRSVYVGGIVGYIEGTTISNCYNTGAVTVTATGTYSSTYAGGIVGQMGNDDAISNCYNTGAVSATSSDSADAGGIAGFAQNSIAISNCYNTGAVTVTSQNDFACAGGIAAHSYQPDISNCYNTGAVSATSQNDFAYAGGIVCVSYFGTGISDCYNTGAVAATSQNDSAYAGGITGYGYGEDDFDTATSNCYNTGAVSASSPSSAYAGGIAGSAPVTISNCYYLDNISAGVGEGTDDAVKCTAEGMKLASTFVGFDFTDTWTMAGNAEYLYPELADVEMIFSKRAVSIAVTTLPTKLSYTEATDALDVMGGKVTVCYNDGTTEEVALSADMVSGFDNTVVGKQTLTVTYGDFTDTFEIEILEASIKLSVTSNVVSNHIVLFVKSDKEISTQVLHIALYSEEGQMLDYIIVPTIEPFTTTNVVFDDDANVKTAKVFLWDSLTTTTPIADAVEVAIR